MRFILLIILLSSCSKPQTMMFDWAKSVNEKESIKLLTRCLEQHNRECKEIESDICQDSVYQCTNDNTDVTL